ncbi:MAG: chorismate mutase [Alphaproteobacteria bacterium]|jgi:chorismate mutase|nr:chorismate mutase [Alphaproteobacteria bacterium]
MPNNVPNLDDLRQQIDRIDGELHDKIMQRTALIDQVAKAKQSLGRHDVAMRPNREAEVVRALAKRHQGQLPTATVIRIWRELINSATALQGPMSVAVCAPARSVAYWDMARNHFGSSAPVTLHTSPSVVMRMVDEQPGIIGLLPFPQSGEENPWWPALASQANDQSGPRVVWRLPFFSSVTGRFEQLEALAVAKLVPEASGDDATLAMVETFLDVSLARVMDQLAECGFAVHPVAVHEQDQQGVRLQLLELDGLVKDEDPAMVAFHEKMDEGLSRVSILGAYPKALTASQAGQTA